MAAMSATIAPTIKILDRLHFSDTNKPPMRGPTIEPIRPKPNAQLDPVERTLVGYTVAAIAFILD
ncbi:hypothetical protein GCM10025859_20510 [Alicyclobacillus fastidiosus]|nr:hypothetical protein GCM10025859_20510 [Alicyclobacillus fastidiosus]